MKGVSRLVSALPNELGASGAGGTIELYPGESTTGAIVIDRCDYRGNTGSGRSGLKLCQHSVKLAPPNEVGTGDTVASAVGVGSAAQRMAGRPEEAAG